MTDGNKTWIECVVENAERKFNDDDDLGKPFGRWSHYRHGDSEKRKFVELKASLVGKNSGEQLAAVLAVIERQVVEDGELDNHSYAMYLFFSLCEEMVKEDDRRDDAPVASPYLRAFILAFKNYYQKAPIKGEGDKIIPFGRFSDWRHSFKLERELFSLFKQLIEAIEPEETEELEEAVEPEEAEELDEAAEPEDTPQEVTIRFLENDLKWDNHTFSHYFIACLKGVDDVDWSGYSSLDGSHNNMRPNSGVVYFMSYKPLDKDLPEEEHRPHLDKVYDVTFRRYRNYAMVISQFGATPGERKYVYEITLGALDNGVTLIREKGGLQLSFNGLQQLPADFSCVCRYSPAAANAAAAEAMQAADAEFAAAFQAALPIAAAGAVEKLAEFTTGTF